jgi:hypothetical protein
MRLLGRRATALDFSCLTCAESVPIPPCVLECIHVAHDGATDRAA